MDPVSREYQKYPVTDSPSTTKKFKKKCSFGKKEKEFLGHIVSAGDIKVDGKQIMVIIDWISPKSITSLRGFLGITSYYKIFVRNYAQIVAPLTSLLKRDTFRWDKDA